MSTHATIRRYALIIEKIGRKQYPSFSDLKEYLNRWYLVGTVGGSGAFRTFGIDRILDLVVRKETFRPLAKADPMGLFEHTVGLTYSGNDRQDVVLSFTPLQGKYVKALSLHHSQQILRDDKNEVRIKLDIIPNYEFKQRILMLGEKVKVVQPQWLAADIRKSLKNTLKKYK